MDDGWEGEGREGEGWNTLDGIGWSGGWGEGGLEEGWNTLDEYLLHPGGVPGSSICSCHCAIKSGRAKETCSSRGDAVGFLFVGVSVGAAYSYALEPFF